MNKKGGETALNKIVVLILVLIVVVIVYIFVVNPRLWDYIKNLPSYEGEKNDSVISEFGEDELIALGCAEVIGKINQKDVGKFVKIMEIYVGKVKTNLYWIYSIKEGVVNEEVIKEGQIRLRINDKQEFSISDMVKDPVVGRLDPVKNTIEIDPDFLDESSQNYLRYEFSPKINKRFPTLNELKLLHGSRRLYNGFYLCKSKEEIEIYKEARKCVESCSLYNGNCRDSGGCYRGEVSYGNLDCRGECCVKESDQKLRDDDLGIDLFGFFSVDDGKKYLGENDLEIEVVPGKFLSSLISINYGETKNNSKNYCYIVRTNKESLLKGYSGESDGSSVIDSERNIRGFNVPWNPSDEKTFEVVGWSNKDNKKVFKRISVKEKVSEYIGRFVSDKDFWNALSSMKDKESFYVFLNKGYSVDSEHFAKNFWIIKENNRAYICVEWGARGVKKRWWELDCGINNPFRVSISLEDVGYSLSETLGKCKWKDSECYYK